MFVAYPEYFPARPRSELSRLHVSRIFLTFLLICVLISGCGKSAGPSPAITDTSKLVVQPGRGIPKVCEIGMSFNDVRKVTGDASKHGIYDRDRFSLRRLTQEKFVLVPSLGVIGVPERKGSLPLLTFYVQPYDSSITIPGLKVTNPFRGSIGTNLSFSSNTVSRKDVEMNFGVVIQNLTTMVKFPTSLTSPNHIPLEATRFTTLGSA
jgi:hypothetical protein